MKIRALWQKFDYIGEFLILFINDIIIILIIHLSKNRDDKNSNMRKWDKYNKRETNIFKSANLKI